MSDGHRLVQAMRQAGKTPQNEIVDIVTGEVTSVSPLKVRVENRELTESFLILGALCKETRIYTPYIIKYDHYHATAPGVTAPAGTPSHVHEIPEQKTKPNKPSEGDYEIMLWRGLRVGDRVLMLKVGRGQKYYIIQREEGAIPT